MRNEKNKHKSKRFNGNLGKKHIYNISFHITKNSEISPFQEHPKSVSDQASD